MSLAGRGVVVTRPLALAEQFADLLKRHGARAIVFPAIEIRPLPAPAAFARAAAFDIIVFVSPSAVRVALPALAPLPRNVSAAAIGTGTRRELERAGVAPVVAPAGGADSEALLREMQDVRGKRVLIVRGEGGRALLGEMLTARGARVEYAECYRRARPQLDPTPLLNAWRGGEVHALTVSSAEALDNFIAMTGPQLAAALPLFVPHERVAAHARSRGLRDLLVAGPGDDEMIERLVAYFDERD